MVRPRESMPPVGGTGDGLRSRLAAMEPSERRGLAGESPAGGKRAPPRPGPDDEDDRRGTVGIGPARGIDHCEDEGEPDVEAEAEK